MICRSKRAFAAWTATVGTSCRGVGQSELSCFTYNNCSAAITTFGDTVGLHGKLTNGCLVLTASGMTSDDKWNYQIQKYQHTEVQIGLLSRW